MGQDRDQLHINVQERLGLDRIVIDHGRNGEVEVLNGYRCDLFCGRLFGENKSDARLVGGFGSIALIMKLKDDVGAGFDQAGLARLVDSGIAPGAWP